MRQLSLALCTPPVHKCLQNALSVFWDTIVFCLDLSRNRKFGFEVSPVALHGFLVKNSVTGICISGECLSILLWLQVRLNRVITSSPLSTVSDRYCRASRPLRGVLSHSSQQTWKVLQLVGNLSGRSVCSFSHRHLLCKLTRLERHHISSLRRHPSAQSDTRHCAFLVNTRSIIS